MSAFDPKRTSEPRAAGYLTKSFQHNKVVMELCALSDD
jgi:hypothetical protein